MCSKQLHMTGVCVCALTEAIAGMAQSATPLKVLSVPFWQTADELPARCSFAANDLHCHIYISNFTQSGSGRLEAATDEGGERD